MSLEQKPGFDPEYPYTMADLSNATGIPNAKLRTIVDHNPDITPFTDPDGHIRFSGRDINLMVEVVNGRKDPKPNGMHEGGKISTRASKKHITLPDGNIIKVKKDTTTTIIIRGILRKQQENKPYTEQQMLNNKIGERFVSDRSWTEDQIVHVGNRLRPYCFKLARHEIEIDGKKTKVLNIIPQEKPTSSPGSVSPKG